MLTFTASIIAALLSLGVINSSSDLDNLSPQQEQEIHQIIIDDDIGV